MRERDGHSAVAWLRSRAQRAARVDTAETLKALGKSFSAKATVDESRRLFEPDGPASTVGRAYPVSHAIRTPGRDHVDHAGNLLVGVVAYPPRRLGHYLAPAELFSSRNAKHRWPMRYRRFDVGSRTHLDPVSLEPWPERLARAIGTGGANAAAVPALRPRPELVCFRKQPPRIEGDHIDQEGLREDRMGDGLVLDAEARGENDPAPHNVPYRADTLRQIEMKVVVG
jgi:hypothetical protein